MSTYGIQGFPLEVTVVGCLNLDDKEWISKQDPYVSLEYGGAKYRTRTCSDGGRNPIFQEKFTLSLIEGLRELHVMVWDSNTLTADEFIGSGRIQLHKVLSQGYDDSSWPLQSKIGRHSGDIRLIFNYSNSNSGRYLPQNTAPVASYHAAAPYAPPVGYHPTYPPSYSPYAPVPTAYTPPSQPHVYPPHAGYSPQPYPLPPGQYYPTGPSGSSGTYPPPPSSSGVYPPRPY